jgi:hypothetical protein
MPNTKGAGPRHKFVPMPTTNELRPFRYDSREYTVARDDIFRPPLMEV